MNWYFKVWKQYADFSGRARRSEYWMFTLLNSIALFAFMLLIHVHMGLAVAYAIYAVAVFIPSLAVAVRRLHDQEKSGWYIFVCLIPLIGSIWLLVLLVSEGTIGENRYGLDPKG